MRRWVRWIVLAALALVLAGCTPAYGPDLSAQTYLYGVATTPSGDAWAVGENGTILHFTAGTWRQVVSPTQADLYAVTLVSAGEGWAVGLDVAAGHAVILHLSNGRWTLVPGIGVPALRGITMVSASEGLAVGDGGTILHYSGGQWRSVPGPSQVNLYGVAMASSQEGWAVGYDTHNVSNGTIDTADILHYQSGVWSNLDPSADPMQSPYRSMRLMGIAALPNGKTWVVGQSGLPHGLVLTYDFNVWAPAAGAGTYALEAIAMLPQPAGWVVGQNGDMLRFDGTGWVQVPRVTTNDLSGVALSSPTEGWAVGDLHTILRLHNGAWSVFHQ